MTRQRRDADRGSAMPRDPVVTPERLLTLFAAEDLEMLIDATFAAVCAAVECDFAAAFYQTTDQGLLKARNSRGGVYDPAFMRRYMELTPALPIVQQRRGVAILPTRSILPRPAKLRRTAFYREIMQTEGWRHAVALCFWSDPPGGVPAFVCSAYRTEGKPDFTTDEVATLHALHAFIDCAVNRLHEREAAATRREAMTMAVDDGSLAFALVDRNLRLVQATRTAVHPLARWGAMPALSAGNVGAVEVPPILRTACRELYEEWQALVRIEPDPPRIRSKRRIAHPTALGVVAEVTIVCPNSALGEPMFLIDLDRRVGMPGHAAAVLSQMTATERAVAMALAQGLSNQEVADNLGKTVSAVKFLLHRIYQKTGLPNRAAVVAALLSVMVDP
jgi:DNA-binding CsgD family transcriptional regulator